MNEENPIITVSPSPDQAVISGKFIRFLALPHPLPEIWRRRFIDFIIDFPGNSEGLQLLEDECRAEIGIMHTRKFIPSRMAVLRASAPGRGA